jgi:hypothetical protein
VSGADPNGECPKCQWSLKDGGCPNPDCDFNDEAGLVIVCAGPPYCSLVGDDAVKAQEAGCPWCSYVHVEEDGREHIDQPGLA